jgi:hypothetical protein
MSGRARAAGVLAVLLLGVYWRPIFLPYALAPSDLIFTTPFFAPAAPPGFTRPSNELLFDRVYQYIPWHRFAHQSLHRGELPLWNPHSLAGMPFAASMSAAAFYPLELALAALPFHRTMVWSAVVRLWVAGFGTWLLGTAYGLGVAAALVAAVAFTFCTYLTVWLGHPHTNIVVLLPLALFLDERLLAAPTRPARLRATALLALVLGVQLTGGHAESSLYFALCLGAHHLIRWWQRGRGPGLVVLPAVAAVLGAMLGAVQLLPFLEWMPLSAEYGHRAAERFAFFDPACWHQLATLPLLVFPDLYNNPTWGSPYRSFLPWGNYAENALYAGVVALALAVAATARWRASAPLRAWTWITLLALALTCQVPPVGWLHYLPGFVLVKTQRLRFVIALGVAMLAGFGADALGEARARRRAAAVLTTVVASALLLAVAAHTVLPALRPRLVAAAQAAAEAKYATVAAPSQPLAHYRAEAEGLADRSIAAFQGVRMYAPALWALAALGALAVRGPRRAALLVVLAAGDGITAGWGYNPSLPLRDFYPATPLAAELAADPGLHRTTALGETLVPDAHMMLGLDDVRGLDFPLRWYDAYLRLVPGRLPWIAYGVLFRDADSPLLQVLNVKYVLGTAPDGSVDVRTVSPVQPRSFLVHEAIVARDDDEAARLLAERPEAVRSRVVLSADGVAPPPLPPTSDRATAEAPALAYQPRRTVWRAETSDAAYLVNTDAYYPGWHAYLDGSPVPLWRANLAFRAVHVPSGAHTVEFRFEPRSVRLGLALGGTAALAIIALLGWSRRTTPSGARGEATARRRATRGARS